MDSDNNRSRFGRSDTIRDIQKRVQYYVWKSSAEASVPAERYKLRQLRLRAYKTGITKLLASRRKRIQEEELRIIINVPVPVEYINVTCKLE